MSILVEAKASRSDFLADKNKLFRQYPEQGMGSFRYFICPKELIMPADLPEKWGLVWVDGKGMTRQRVGPRGNIWTSDNWGPFLFKERNRRAEEQMMYSALRRISNRGLLENIYNKEY